MPLIASVRWMNTRQAQMSNKLTMAQVYVLRRLDSDTKYQIRGDGKKARECRPSSNRVFTDDVSCPSLPVLYRYALVAIAGMPKNPDPNLFYSVSLTLEGRQELKRNAGRKD